LCLRRSAPAPSRMDHELLWGRPRDDLGIISSSAKGVFLVPITDGNKTINFILSFGVGRHLLKEGVVEERFGLKVRLELRGPESFRSIDKPRLGRCRSTAESR